MERSSRATREDSGLRRPGGERENRQPPGDSRFRGTGWTRPVSPGVRCMPWNSPPPPRWGGTSLKVPSAGGAASRQPPRKSDYYAYFGPPPFRVPRTLRGAPRAAQEDFLPLPPPPAEAHTARRPRRRPRHPCHQRHPRYTPGHPRAELHSHPWSQTCGVRGMRSCGPVATG